MKTFIHIIFITSSTEKSKFSTIRRNYTFMFTYFVIFILDNKNKINRILKESLMTPTFKSYHTI